MDPLQIVTYSLLFITLYGEVFLLLAFADSYDETASTAPLTLPPIVPKVAIIVPCYNEEKTVAKTILSLLALDYPREMLEVLVVNDGSKDDTLAAAHAASTDSRVRVFSKENGGKHSAMNFALKHTNAEIVGCLDADSYVEPQSLIASIRQLHDTGAVAVTPAIIPNKPTNVLQLIQQAEYGLSVFIRRAFSAAGAIFITPGPFSLFRRDVIDTLGGWRHAHGTEDLEIGLRLQEHRYLITNTPHARAITNTPTTLGALYKQRVRWTYGFIMNALDYKHMFFNRRYGSLGMVLLPAAFISIFTALYFTIQMIVFTTVDVFDSLTRLSIVGFHAPTWPQLFYFNTTELALLAYILISVALSLIFIGKRMAGRSWFSFDIPLYLALYGFLAPLWLTGAVVRAARGRQAPWR
jgi:peptidoglycan-N-acetylglucosamine deacetylase